VSLLSFDQISERTSVYQNLVIYCDGSNFCHALICWGKVCGKWMLIFMAIIKMKKVLGRSSFKNVKIFFLFADAGTNSSNLVSSAHW
jgi:hypothetical protein